MADIHACASDTFEASDFEGDDVTCTGVHETPYVSPEAEEDFAAGCDIPFSATTGMAFWHSQQRSPTR